MAQIAVAGCAISFVGFVCEIRWSQVRTVGRSLATVHTVDCLLLFYCFPKRKTKPAVKPRLYWVEEPKPVMTYSGARRRPRLGETL